MCFASSYINQLKTGHNLFTPYQIAKFSEKNKKISIILKKQNLSIAGLIKHFKEVIKDYINFTILVCNNSFHTNIFSKLNKNLYDEDFFK